jgi:hypothetical protein
MALNFTTQSTAACYSVLMIKCTHLCHHFLINSKLLIKVAVICQLEFLLGMQRRSFNCRSHIASNVMGRGAITVTIWWCCWIATVGNVLKTGGLSTGISWILVTEWHVRSDGEEKWASIPSGSFSRLYHICRSGLSVISVFSMCVIDGIVWHGQCNSFRHFDHCVSQT